MAAAPRYRRHLPVELPVTTVVAFMRFTHKIPKIYSNHADGDNWTIKRGQFGYRELLYGKPVI
jgi:hypothetical protein